MTSLHALVLLLAGASCLAGPTEDLIVDLPGLGYPIPFDQYSGYLNGTDGRKLHYWLTESQNDASTDPLILWLNGGPGCSSLMGLLTELGPFRVASDGSGILSPNIYSWNMRANVVFLESPACVGFSYDENSNCVTSDTEVAEMNYLALQDFFLKFPEYVGREFYVTGESYGGIYVPTLSVKIVQGLDTYPINFQGYAIGNGLLSYSNNDNSLIFFAYYHALLGQAHWNNLVTECCGGVENKETCNFNGDITAACSAQVVLAYGVIYASGLNEYNLYGDCLTSGDATKDEYSYAVDNLFRQNKINLPETYSDPPCTDNSNERSFLNDADVRASLNIPEFVQDWDICSDDVSSTYGRDYDNSTAQIAILQSAGYRGLVYNGDVDMACNFLGNTWDLVSLGLPTVESRHKWEVAGDVAGYVVRYPNLDFVTVRGSGHMVPADKAEQALSMITSFLNDEPY